jgi:hypothetical protein
MRKAVRAKVRSQGDGRVSIAGGCGACGAFTAGSTVLAPPRGEEFLVLLKMHIDRGQEFHCGAARKTVSE